MGKGVTFVWRTDVHLADTPPQSRTDNWTETLLGKLQQVGDLAKKVKAEAVLDGGDLFHLKSPSRNSHEMVGKVASVQASYPCPVYGCVGNHDVKYGSLDFLDESPLGVLFGTGSIRRLYNQHEAIFEKDGVKVRVIGIPYHGTTYEMERFQQIQRGDEDYLVAVAHVLASHDGGTMFESEDVLSYKSLQNTAPDVWCFGHWHKNQGVEVINGKHFVNIGSLSRGSLNQDDVNRTPSCAVLNFTKEEIKVIPIPLKVEAAADVFNIERKMRAEAKEVNMEAFVDSLKETLVTREGDSLMEHIRELPNVASEIKEKAMYYLEQAAK